MEKENDGAGNKAEDGGADGGGKEGGQVANKDG